MKKVRINPGCIGCGLCAEIAPQVFVVNNKSTVIEEADLKANAEKIKEAARQCPVGVIEYDQE